MLYNLEQLKILTWGREEIFEVREEIFEVTYHLKDKNLIKLNSVVIILGKHGNRTPYFTQLEAL